MACNADYMNPTEKKIAVSIVYSLLDELETGELNQNHYKGYHPEAYTKQLNYKQFTENVQKLCKTLTNTNVTKYSLEMQMWWRTHQEEDRKREAKELELLKIKEETDAAWNKLTDEEKLLIAESYFSKSEKEVLIVPKGFEINHDGGIKRVVFKLNH